MPTEPERPAREYVLAHLSDPHLSSLHGVRKRDLLSKRVLGYQSWRTRRRREHLSSVLSALLRDTRVVPSTRPVAFSSSSTWIAIQVAATGPGKT